MELLERGPEIEVLHALLRSAERRDGRVAVVAGQAGVGKTALVDRLCREAAHEGARVLRGACDALATPRVLGPLRDIAMETDGPLGSAISDGVDRDTLFETFRATLGAVRTTLVVIEDAHWADDATLDLLRFVGRRLDGLRVLLVVTYRDDEVPAGHPLRVLLGDLGAGGRLARVRLGPLSPEAVVTLAAGAAVDAEDLYANTGGNPFYVTEVLASGADGVPTSVSEAVLARASRLPAAARAVLDAAAVVPGRISRTLLEATTAADAGQLDACVQGGMLRPDGDGFAFRHEIARRAIEEAVSPARRADLHARVLAALLLDGPEIDHARAAHHAERCGDDPAVLRHATAAGRRAAEAGSHREARDQFARAAARADRLPPAERAQLLEQHALHCAYTDAAAEGLESQRRAVALWQEVGEVARAGSASCWLAILLGLSGDTAAGEEVQARAVDLLEQLPPGPELAFAYAVRAHSRMLVRELPEALAWGHRAIELAELTGADAALTRALDAVGCAQIFAGDPAAGRTTLERNLDLAVQRGLRADANRVLSNLGSAFGEVRDYGVADPYLLRTIAFAREHDHDNHLHYATSWWARTQLEQGRWDDAVEAAASVLRGERVVPMSRITALTVLGRVRARRGDPGVESALDEAWELAAGMAHLQRTWPVAAARAEAAWLAGRPAAIPGLVTDTLRLARRLGHRWAVGELAYWLWRVGDLQEVPEDAFAPYALQIAGQPVEAAEAWARIGCPYERASALADSGDEGLEREALGAFRRLGAAVDATRLERRLREGGVRGLPRGPRPATRHNPAELTPRQLEVLTLLAEGASNAGIAQRLFISEKTAGHHVSAVLAKLGVRTRGEAARAARDLGIGASSPQGGDLGHRT
jgi:DNA-binding CsgD family transcriptional regulator/tetratricopeptide (TPR) repeat protein